MFDVHEDLHHVLMHRNRVAFETIWCSIYLDKIVPNFNISHTMTIMISLSVLARILISVNP